MNKVPCQVDVPVEIFSDFLAALKQLGLSVTFDGGEINYASCKAVSKTKSHRRKSGKRLPPNTKSSVRQSGRWPADRGKSGAYYCWLVIKEFANKNPRSPAEWQESVAHWRLVGGHSPTVADWFTKFSDKNVRRYVSDLIGMGLMSVV